MALNFNHETNFDGDIPQYLQCPSCRFILRNPMIFLQCGHRFCGSCMEGFGSPILCPVDRTEIDQSQVLEDNIAQKAIKNLSVFCSFLENGCRWKGQLQDLQAHTDKCPFRNGEDFSSEEMFDNLSYKFEMLEMDMGEKNDKLLALTKDVKNLLEENKILRGELTDAKNGIEFLKSFILNDGDVFMQKGENFENRLATLEESYKDVISLKADVQQLKDGKDSQSGSSFVVKEDIVTSIDGEINDKVEIMETISDTKLHCHESEGEGKLEEVERSIRTMGGEQGISSNDLECDSGVTLGLDGALNDAIICNVQEVSMTKTVFQQTFEGIGCIQELGNRVYGEKFYCRPRGNRFRLVIDWNPLDKRCFKVGLQACRGINGNVLGYQFDREITLRFVDCPHPPHTFPVLWVSKRTAKDYGETFIVHPVGGENENNIYWFGQIILNFDFETSDALTIQCTMEKKF